MSPGSSLCSAPAIHPIQQSISISRHSSSAPCQPTSKHLDSPDWIRAAARAPPLQTPANARCSTGSGDCVATAAAVNGTSARRDYVAMAPPPTRPMPPPPPWPMPPPPPGADAKKADSIVGQRSKLFFSLQYRQGCAIAIAILQAGAGRRASFGSLPLASLSATRLA